MNEDDAVAALVPAAFELLMDLVRADSSVGHEAAAQEVLAEALTRAGFTVEQLAIPAAIAEDPLAGVPLVPYEGRYVLVARRSGTEPDAAPSLLLNGHMDVVPAEDAGGWSTPPFEPLEQDGWLLGRGAGDMKGGFAMGWLAIRALDTARPGWQRGDLVLVSAIEEECTGNGTLAACRAGVVADAALLLEPTDLDLLLAGIAIAWIEIVIEGRSGHAEAAGRSVNPILAAAPVLDGLRRLERRMNDEHAAGGDAPFASIPDPYLVNVGRFHSGSWASSVPEVARLEVRVGHPAGWSAEETLEQVRDAVREASAGDEWLTEHPPVMRLTGYRAERYAQDADHPFVQRLSAAHESVHGTAPAAVVIGSTTDARYYLNQVGIPAVAYGPRTRNIHGVDEAVELASIAAGARTLTRFLADWLGGEGAGDGG
jgi:acetylornithine deacetylase